jgi:hypothetical protein
MMRGKPMLTEIRTELTFASGRRHAVVCKVVAGDVPDAIETMNLAIEYYLMDLPDGPQPRGKAK